MRPALDLFFPPTDDQLTFAEFWAYYETFITELLPVAESANVKLSVHPNGPPGSCNSFCAMDCRPNP